MHIKRDHVKGKNQKSVNLHVQEQADFSFGQESFGFFVLFFGEMMMMMVIKKALLFPALQTPGPSRDKSQTPAHVPVLQRKYQVMGPKRPRRYMAAPLGLQPD